MADADEEDSWLYGDKVKTESVEADSSQPAADPALKQTEVPDEEPKLEETPTKNSSQTTNGTENVNNSLEVPVSTPADIQAGTDKRNVNGDDSDESDDDVQVTIGAISTGPGGNDNGGIFPLTGSGSRHLYRNPVQVIGTPKATVGKGLDLAAPGNINGQAAIDFNLDSLEDKPWRKPGADISDYFNYGFNEVTWKIYCEKQKRLRSGMDAPVLPQSTPGSAERNSSVLSSILSKYENKQRLPLTPVANRFENSVRSISTLQFTRRKDDGLPPRTPDTSITVTSTVGSTPSASPLTQTTSPMYTIPAVNGPAIPIQFDPTKPPPTLPIGLPPHAFPGGATMMPPTLRPPGTEFVQLPPVSGAPFPPPPGGYLVPPVSQPQQQQQQPFFVSEEGEERRSQPENPRSDDESRYSREPRTSSSRRDYERERDRYSRRSDYRDGRDDYPERSRERDRDRDRPRERDRDRDRDRDRERERDRDRDGRRRRDDSPSRHKSTRRKHEEDERYNSSSTKHKKAKKHKHKGKDGSGGDEEPMLTEDQIKKEPM